MAELPKIVRSRLAQQRSADQAAHPDANLLAAFAEQTLLERERAAVVVHLAQCADCRESLAVAATAVPPAVDQAPAATKRRWFLEWRWVGAAAAACCVIAVALQYRVQPPVVQQTRYTSVPPAGVAPSPLAEQPSTPFAVAPKLKPDQLKKALQRPPQPSLAQELGPPSAMTQLDTSAPERNPAAVAILPVEPRAPAEQANSLLPSALDPKALRPETTEALRGQKDIIATQGQSGLRPQASAFAPRLIARAPLAAAGKVSNVSQPAVLWSINASPATAGSVHGVVERSLDAGKTWEAAQLGDDVSFRTVASVGPHVWAGGTNGALFHSADEGAHWEQITVSEDGARLTGTIVNIDLRDANLIKITTSSGEKWFSQDGGRQWKRQ